MRARILAIGAAVWTAVNAGIYLLVISAQGNSPAWWYPAILGISVLLFVLAACRLWPVPMLITGAVLLTSAALVGVLSIGLSLVPGVLAAVAALGPTRRPPAGQPRPTRPRARMPAG
jgi:hypothetical protein